MNKHNVTINATVVGYVRSRKVVGPVVGFDNGTPIVRSAPGEYVALPDCRFAY